MRIRQVWSRLEDRLVGHVAPEVRYNLRVELVATFCYGSFGTILAFLPLVLRRLGASAGLLGVYTAVAYLGNVLATPGLRLVRPGRFKRFLVTCWLISRSAFLLAAFVTGDLGLLILAACFYLLDQLPTPVYSAIVQEMYPVQDRGRVLALVRMGMAVPLLFLTPLAGLALDRVGYRLLLPIASVIGIVGVLIITRLRVDEDKLRPRPSERSGQGGAILRRDKRFVFYLAGLAIFGLGSLIPNPVYPLVQADRLGLSYTQIGLLNLCFSFARLASYYFWGDRIDRWGGVRVLQVAFFINILVSLPYIWATNGWMLLPSFFAQGVVNSAIDLGFISASIQLAQTGRVPEYASLQATLIGLRGVAGPLLGVALLRAGMDYNTIFVSGAVLSLGAALILSYVEPPRAASPERARTRADEATAE